MPNCVSSGCYNSSKKGSYLIRFPSNEKLRRIWEERVNRPGWSSTKHSYLCEDHFNSEQWEILASGHRKLKTDAIPSKQSFNFRSEYKPTTRDTENSRKIAVDIFAADIRGRKKLVTSASTSNTMKRKSFEDEAIQTSKKSRIPLRSLTNNSVMKETSISTHSNVNKFIDCQSQSVLSVDLNCSTLKTNSLQYRNEICTDTEAFTDNLYVSHTFPLPFKNTIEIGPISDDLARKEEPQPLTKQTPCNELPKDVEGTVQQTFIINSSNTQCEDSSDIEHPDVLKALIQEEKEAEHVSKTCAKVVKLSKDYDVTDLGFIQSYNRNGNPSKLILLSSHTENLQAMPYDCAFQADMNNCEFESIARPVQADEIKTPQSIGVDTANDLLSGLKQKLNINLNMNMHQKFSEVDNMSKMLEQKDDEILALKAELVKKNKLISNLFNSDQIRKLEVGHHFGHKWSDETVQKSLKLKFACGTTGYETLISEGYPLPAIRTLSRRIDHIKFHPGILYEVFEILPDKVHSMQPQDRECNLVIDEVAVVEGVLYDPSTKEVLGYINLPADSTQRAKKCLVMMLTGLRARWKQVIAYFFTSPSLDGALLKPVILEIITLSWNIGLKVRNFVSDMGPQNLQVWKSFGIVCGRYSVLVNKIEHPCSREENLWFMPDPEHAHKNFRSSIENNEEVKLPESVCAKYGLVSPYVCFKHLDEIVSYEKEDVIKLAHDASKIKLHPNSFEKMKARTARNLINDDTAAALEFWANEKEKPEYTTTAWFIRQVSKWYKLMSSNNRVFALSYRDKDKYDEAVDFLLFFIDMVENMSIGNVWKPIQTAVKIATTTVLELSKYLLDVMKYDFVLVAHMNSNCIENIFSVVKSKHPTPNCLQFKQDLRNLCISQFMKIVTTSSYDFDDADFLTSLFERRKVDKQPATIASPASYPVLKTHTVEFSAGNLNALYCIFGHVIIKIMRRQKTCNSCFDTLISKRPLKLHYTRYIRLKEYKFNSLVHVTELTFRFFLELESLFLLSEPYFKNDVDCEKFLIWQFEQNEFVKNFSAPPCHNIKSKMIHKYASFRLKINNQKSKEVISAALSEVPASTGSRSMAMRCYINRKKK